MNSEVITPQNLIFSLLQSDKKMVATVEYLFDLCRGQQKQSVEKPWIVRMDVDEMETDEAQKKVEGKQSAPYLFIYFEATSEFKGAVICADGCKVCVRTCLSNAILAYVAVYHVCQVGYNKHWAMFMNLLEHVCLGVQFQKVKYMPIKLEKFLNERHGLVRVDAPAQE